MKATEIGRLSWAAWVAQCHQKVLRRVTEYVPLEAESDRGLEEAAGFGDEGSGQGKEAASRSWKRQGVNSSQKPSRGSTTLQTLRF